MKVSHLLMGAGAAALTAGAANAQGISLASDDYAAITNLSGTPVTGEAWFASELPTIDGILVPFEFELRPAAGQTFATAPNVEALIRVDFTNGFLSRTLSDNDIEDPSGSCTSAETTVDSGGAAGDSFVVFRVNDIGDCDTAGPASVAPSAAAVLQFTTPLELDGGPVTMNVSITNAANGNTIASGSWGSSGVNQTFSGFAPGPLVSTRSAVSTTFTQAYAQADASAVPAYSAFDSATMGTFTFASSGVFFDGTLTPVGAGQINTATLSCPFDSTAGLDSSSHSLGAATNTSGTAMTNPVTFNILPHLGGGAGTFTLATGATAPIVMQNISCSGTVAYTPATGMVDTDFSGSLGYIRREGQVSQVFEWVGAAGQATRNIFRITGLAFPVTTTVVVSNSSTGLNGEYSLGTLFPTNGEVILTEQQLTAAIGNYGRANVQFSYQVLPFVAPDITTRRFLVGNNGTLTDFGTENEDSTSAPAAPVPPTGPIGGGFN